MRGGFAGRRPARVRAPERRPACKRVDRPLGRGGGPARLTRSKAGGSSARCGASGSEAGSVSASSERVVMSASFGCLESADLVLEFGEASFDELGELGDCHSVEVSDWSGRARAQERYDRIVARHAHGARKRRRRGAGRRSRSFVFCKTPMNTFSSAL